MALSCKTFWRSSGAGLGVLACGFLMSTAAPARADFFDDVRRTFQTDIPHFFQDDIPCAFGGQPTSHTRTSCHGSERPAPHAGPKNASTPPTATPSPPPVHPRAPEVREPPEYP